MPFASELINPKRGAPECRERGKALPQALKERKKGRKKPTHTHTETERETGTHTQGTPSLGRRSTSLTISSFTMSRPRSWHRFRRLSCSFSAVLWEVFKGVTIRATRRVLYSDDCWGAGFFGSKEWLKMDSADKFLTMGGPLAGTQFHSHGPAFLLLASGKKRCLAQKVSQP